MYLKIVSFNLCENPYTIKKIILNLLKYGC